MEFDLAAGILGFEIEDVPKKTALIEKGDSFKVFQDVNVSSDDQNVKAAAALSIFFGLTSFLENSLEVTNVCSKQ